MPTLAAMRVTRRGLLAGGALGVGTAVGAGALVEYDVLPGRTRAYDLLGLDGGDGVIPDVPTGSVERGELDGLGWRIFHPPGEPTRLPVVVALGGAHQRVESLENDLGLGAFLAASGERFAIAGIEGEGSYWHPRKDGSDTGRTVLEHFLPLLGERGLDVTRPGFLGWSMGGYGSLLLATERVEAGQPVGPIAATSPAVWTSYGDSTGGAFDSQEDFDEYGIFGRTDLLDGLDVRIDCGRGDPFYRNVVELTERVEADVHLEAGDHTAGYWTRVLPAQLAWLGGRLTAEESAADAQ